MGLYCIYLVVYINYHVRPTLGWS